MESRPWHRQYDPGVPASLEYDELAVPHYLDRAVERVPNRTAIVFQNKRLSYRELRDDVDRLAAAFDSLGAQPGTCIAIHLPNIPQAVIAYYAALRIGARVVLTNPLYTAHEIEHQWNDAGCEIAITMDFLWDQKVRAMRGSTSVKSFIIASIPEYLAFPLNFLAPFKLRKADPPAIAKVRTETGVHLFKKLLGSVHRAPPAPPIDLDDIAVLQYTGGTTGVSKGAVLTHRNIAANTQQTNAWFSDAEYGKEVVMTCLPLFHVFGMTVCMNLAIRAGATIVLIANPRDAGGLVAATEKHRVTIFPGVPALYNSMNNFPGIEKADVSSVRYCVSGSAPIPPDVQLRFEQLTGSKIIEGFGMSESSPLTHANPLFGERRIGSVGIPVPDTDARIVDPDDPDVELACGEEGELIMSGPQVMSGYWNRPEETAATMHGKWLRTGDLATVDAEGYFRIVGRKKDMINCSGMKVFPDEVDALLMAHDSILEAATIGVPHPTRGESVKSFVVLQPGASLTPDEIEAYCRESLASYKIPREIEFLDELPKSSVLKVLRRELRDREMAKRGSGGAIAPDGPK